MSDPLYYDIVNYLLQNLPEIQACYSRRLKELYAEGNTHVIFGSILVGYLNDLALDLGGPRHDVADKTLKKAFGMIENLVTSTDFQTRCLAETSVLEGLCGEKNGFKIFGPFMGPVTNRLALRLIESWKPDPKSML